MASISSRNDYHLHLSTSSGYYDYAYTFEIDSPKETKKEKRDRISKELMYTSWQVYNQMTMTIRKVIQICKPQYKLNI